METDPAGTDNPFTQFYGQLLHQGNMMGDYVRTGTYQRAMQSNASDFLDKVVLDVGTGSGILAFFALQCGAKKVYAVDASDAVNIAEKLARSNGFSEDRMVIIKGKIEEVDLPERVDVIVSEPIGFLLVHERMLESYVAARDKFLKPGGLMMPASGSIIIAPLSDHALFKEQSDKVAFWDCGEFFGLDLRPMLDQAKEEFFSQAIVGYVDASSLISAHRTVHTIDFNEVSGEDLSCFEVPFSFRIDRTSIMHGFAGWFDLDFIGSSEHIVLSTSPESPGTHWYQCRMLFREPLAVNKGQVVTGSMLFQANEFFSYHIDITAFIEGTGVTTRNRINLKDQVTDLPTCMSD